LLDSSSSNGWLKFHHGLTLRDAFARVVDCIGPTRILFGTDSSFFPRGWQQPILETQKGICDELGLDVVAQDSIFGGNFNRLFG
jgi:predicted TIM-barrel fold metal-dependent hydrolase